MVVTRLRLTKGRFVKHFLRTLSSGLLRHSYQHIDTVYYNDIVRKYVAVSFLCRLFVVDLIETLKKIALDCTQALVKITMKCLSYM